MGNKTAEIYIRPYALQSPCPFFAICEKSVFPVTNVYGVGTQNVENIYAKAQRF